MRRLEFLGLGFRVLGLRTVRWRESTNIAALMIIRIGFWGPLYYSYKGTPEIV